MATSGSFRTSAYDSRCLEFAWSRKSYSIANNTTTISWTLHARGKGNWGQINAGNFLVKIDGSQEYFSSARITTTDGLYIAGGEYTFKHNNDGTKSFTAYVEAGIYTYAVNCSGSEPFTLDSIPRQATLTSAPNFNDEQNPTIYYSNPAGNAVSKLEACISLTGAIADIRYRDISKTDGSYTFELTESERQVLRTATMDGNTRTVIFFVRTIIGDELYHSVLYKTFTVINCEPTATITIRDNNPDTTALTGNPDVFVKGHSTAAFTITGTARKEAEITKYLCMGQEVNATDAILNVPTGNITYGVVDNRGNKFNSSVSKTLINYVDVSCRQEVNITLTGETTAEITMTLEGNYYNGSFGQVNNELRLEVRYKPTDGQWSNWIPLTEAHTPTYSNNTYRLTAPIPYDFDYSTVYTIESRVSDKLTTYSTGEYTARLTPVFDWSETDFNFNVPVRINDSPLYDFVVGQGTSNGWTYRLWSSGMAECWRRLQLSGVNVSNAWGNLYTSGSLSSTNLSYPFTFTETPILSVSLMPFGAGGLIMATGNGYGSATQTGPFEIARGTAITNTQYLLSYYATGRWK